MKKLEAVIQGCKIDEVREALAKEKIPRLTIFEVKGAGNSQGRVQEYRGVRYIEDATDFKIEMVVDDDDAERIAQRIVDTLQTGNLSDAEVIIFPIEQDFRLRVGHEMHRSKYDSVSSYMMGDTAHPRSYVDVLKRKFHKVGRSLW